MKPENEAWLIQAQVLTQDLLFPSESDEVIIPFVWEELPENSWNEKLLQLADNQVIINFFTKVVTIKDWFGEAEIQEAQKFKALVDFMQNSLQNLQMIQEGEIEVKVFILGQLASGDWAGIQTMLVQT